MTVILVAMGPTAPGDGLIAGVTSLRRAGHRVQLVTRHSPSADLATVLDDVTPMPAGRPASRPISVGKLRLDLDRLPGAARLNHSEWFTGALTDGTVLVALDPAAVPAVWWAARRHRGVAAFNGLPAAVARYSSRA